MPWKSRQQEKWGNSSSGKKAMGQESINEFNAATKGKKLPMRKKPPIEAPRKGRPLMNMNFNQEENQ
jgi:hypothetical protein